MLLTDDRGEPVHLRVVPRRIVSLVPSDTYTLVRLGAGERLVGRTKYCVEPAELVRDVEAVGGTKDPDIERILDLLPDVVVMNREENTRRDWERIVDKGVPVLTTCPQRMTDGAAQVARLARLLGDVGDDAKSAVRSVYETMKRLSASASTSTSTKNIRVFVPIWMSPLMTANGATFMSDVLETAGASNVFSDRERRFPLAADLGRGPEFAAERTDGKDTRYPRITLEEVRERAPELVLLPDEPHPFSEEDAAVFRGLGIPGLAEQNVRFCSGKALMWPGMMSIEEHEHVRALVQEARVVASQMSPR